MQHPLHDQSYVELWSLQQTSGNTAFAVTLPVYLSKYFRNVLADSSPVSWIGRESWGNMHLVRRKRPGYTLTMGKVAEKVHKRILITEKSSLEILLIGNLLL